MTAPRPRHRIFVGKDVHKFSSAHMTVFPDGSKERLHGHNFMVDESVWSGRAPGKPFGLEGRNRPLSFRLLHVMEFGDSGDIKRENVWLDLAAIMQQLPQG